MHHFTNFNSPYWTIIMIITITIIFIILSFRLVEHIEVTILGFLTPFIVLLAAQNLLPIFALAVGSPEISPFGMVFLLLGVSALVGIIVFANLYSVFNRYNAHFKSLSYNVFFGICFFFGFHLLLLLLDSTQQDLVDRFPLEMLYLLGFYLLFVSFRLFLQSLLVGMIFWFYSLTKKSVPHFVPLLEWNEPFSSPLKLILAATLLYVIPLLEFLIETLYWPGLKHSQMWNLGGMLPKLEKHCTTDHGQGKISEGSKHSFFILGIPLTFVLLIFYVVVFYVAGIQVPTEEQTTSSGQLSTPSPQIMGKKLVRAKGLLEYFFLVSSQLILLNPVSFLVATIIWPVWKIWLTKYPFWNCGNFKQSAINQDRQVDNNPEMNTYEANRANVLSVQVETQV